MAHGMACIEIRDGLVWRIFRSRKAAAVAGITCQISMMAYVDAVRTIRQQLYKLCEGLCSWCGQEVSWEACQMHEKVYRGKGGEISMTNSVILCYGCHQGRKDSAHGNRRPMWGLSKQSVVQSD